MVGKKNKWNRICICFFDELVKALSVFSEDLYEEFDLRPVHILVEFGNVMEKRVNYLLDNGLIKKNKKTDELQKVLQKYIK